VIPVHLAEVIKVETGMYCDPAEDYKNDTAEYLKGIEGDFFFDHTHRIYKPKAYYEEQKSSGLKKFWKNCRRYWLPILVNALTLAAVAYYAHYARLQWCEMVKATKAADASARAAKIAADASVCALKQNEKQFAATLGQMKESNHINSESLISVQRPFVNFVDIAADIPPLTASDKSRLWTFQAVVENSGNTPAVSRRGFFMGLPFMPPGQKRGPSEDSFLGANAVHYPGVMGPKSTDKIGPIQWDEAYILGDTSLKDWGSDKFNEGLAKAVQSRLSFFWGWVAYKDAFPNTNLHVTEFCKLVLGIEIRNDSHAYFKFHDCAEHNCQDKDCQDYQRVVNLFNKLN
jgi:hypothetical protein